MISKINIKNRTIFCKDNIDILRGINTESIDLIYLDPPFNKNKKFTAPIGSSAKGASFKDIFRREDVKDEWVSNIKIDYESLYTFLMGVKNMSNIFSTHKNNHYLYNYCYLVYMAARLIEMQRILKDTGSIYFHCDQTMSHYIKILMDIIFGEDNFRNEIVWHYGKWSNVTTNFQKNHDIILRYSKNENCTFNPIFYKTDITKKYHTNVVKGQGQLLIYDKNLSQDIIDQYKSKEYKIVLVSKKGVLEHDVWTYVRDKKFNFLNSQSKERTGYPTQKPLALLKRIIEASSNKGDVVLDPFCGCATTCVASELLGRQWIGIDVSGDAYRLVWKRLNKEIKLNQKNQKSLFSDLYEIHFKTDSPKRTDFISDEGDKKYVYIISNPAFIGLYKVGVAKDYKKRLNSYQTSDPERNYKIEFAFYTHLYDEIEKHIHQTFMNKHEWVKGDLEKIKDSIKNFKK